MEDTHPPAAEVQSGELLWERFMADRDPESRNALVEMYLPWCRRIARMLYAQRGGLSAEPIEYVQMATLGLIEAIESFDAGRGTHFEAYALKRIRGAVLNDLQSLSEKHAQVGLQKRLQSQRVASLMEEDGTQAANARDTLFEQLARVTLGLAIGYMLEGTSMLVDTKGGLTPRREFYDSVEMRQRQEIVRGMVESLPPQHRRVMRYHYFQGLSFTDVAGLLGLTKGRVSQIHRQALEILRDRVKTRPGAIF